MITSNGEVGEMGVGRPWTVSQSVVLTGVPVEPKMCLRDREGLVLVAVVVILADGLTSLLNRPVGGLRTTRR